MVISLISWTLHRNKKQKEQEVSQSITEENYRDSLRGINYTIPPHPFIGISLLSFPFPTSLASRAGDTTGVWWRWLVQLNSAGWRLWCWWYHFTLCSSEECLITQLQEDVDWAKTKKKQPKKKHFNEHVDWGVALACSQSKWDEALWLWK